jgi:hypothetical protein
MHVSKISLKVLFVATTPTLTTYVYSDGSTYTPASGDTCVTGIGARVWLYFDFTASVEL